MSGKVEDPKGNTKPRVNPKLDKNESGYFDTCSDSDPNKKGLEHFEQLASYVIPAEYFDFLSVDDRILIGAYNVREANEAKHGPALCSVHNDAAFAKALKFSANLKKWRLRRGYSISDLASHAQIEPRTIAAAELLPVCDALIVTIPFADVIRLCGALEVSLNSFVS